MTGTQTSLERLREMVTLRVEATSLRSVARQVGMSPSGLDKFLHGGTPYTKSRRKLFNWLHRERGHFRPELAAEGIAAALDSLVHDLPPERRDRAVVALLETLHGVYQGCVDTAPPWLAELSARVGMGEPEAPPPDAPPAEA